MEGVVHFEIPAEDVKRAQKFYKELFGWNMTQMGPEFGNYIMIQTGKTGKDGMSQEKGKINGGMITREKDYDSTVLVIGVQDIDASLKKAKAMGAKVVADKHEIPNVGIYARIKDPDGNIIGLLQPAM